MTGPVAVTVSLNPPVQVALATTGPAGPNGPIGPAGPSGILATLRGAWSSGTTYGASTPPDAVIGSNGHWYVSLSNGNIGHDPVSDGGVRWADQLPPAVVSASSSTDPVGRTQALGTSTIKAPGLRQFVYVDDAPFGAVGDVKRVSDGAMTSGSNVVTSATSNFAVGHVVEVVGAGPTPGTQPNLSGYVKTTTGTTATLVSTVGGSTPVNASATVTGVVVTYGTDDTASCQAASAAVTAAGGGTVGFMPFKGYWFNGFSPTSNVTYSGNGAVFYVLLLPSVNVNPNPAINLNQSQGFGTSGVSNVTFRGMIWQGHGADYHNQNPITIRGAVNFRLYDCTFYNYVTFVTGFVDVNGVRAVNNDYYGCCAVTTLTGQGFANPLQFSTSSLSDTYPMTDILAQGNRLMGLNGGLGPGGEGIIVQGNGAGPGVTPPRVVIVDNDVQMSTSIGGGAIVAEWGGASIPTSPGEKFVIANNTIVNGTIGCANDSIPISANPALFARWVIQGNEIEVSTPTSLFAIQFQGSYGAISGNVIKAPQGINVTTPASAGMPVAVTGNITSASNQIASVANGSTVINGTPLIGTGIPAGAFLLSGGGTATWTLNANATATTTGLAITAKCQSVGVNVTGNVIHCLGTATTPYGIFFSQTRNSTISNNTITFDTGTYSGFAAGIRADFCGWIRIRGNDIDYPPIYGIFGSTSNDLTVMGNSIYNGWNTNWIGVRFNVATGANNLIADNLFVDDRPTPIMFNAVQNGGTSFNVRVLRNVWIGWTNSPMDSFTGVANVEGNLPYHRNFPLTVTVTTPPLTTVAYTNSQPWPVYAYFSGGTITAITKAHPGGGQVALGTPTCIYLRPGDSFTPTYTGSPTLTIDAA